MPINIKTLLAAKKLLESKDKPQIANWPQLNARLRLVQEQYHQRKGLEGAALMDTILLQAVNPRS